MNTIRSLFPDSPFKAGEFEIYPVSAIFHATLSGGVYDFSPTAAIEIGTLAQLQKGIIAGIDFSSNVSENDFTAAMGSSFLEMNIRHGGNGTPINLAPFKFSNFASGGSYTSQFKVISTSGRNLESFNMKINGSVKQIGVNTDLYLYAVLNFIKTMRDV